MEPILSVLKLTDHYESCREEYEKSNEKKRSGRGDSDCIAMHDHGFVQLP